MLNDRIQTISRLQSALSKAEDHLSKLPPDAPYSEFEFAYASTLILAYAFQLACVLLDFCQSGDFT